MVVSEIQVYSVDEVHSHFRMALYGRYSFNNSDVHQRAIDLNGHNSGYEGGFIATKLKNNGNKNRHAANYTLSVGKLMLPKEYTSYQQTNLNLMVEVLGQVNLNTGYSFLDIAPSVQFIFLSKMRLDAAYRIPLVKDLTRTASDGFLIRLKYNIFNAY